jgi:hypothetical protein
MLVRASTSKLEGRIESKTIEKFSKCHLKKFWKKSCWGRRVKNFYFIFGK